MKPDLQHLEASSIRDAHTKQQMVPRVLRMTGEQGQGCAHAPGSCFQEPLLPQVWDSKRVTANGRPQLEGGGCPTQKAGFVLAPCGNSHWLSDGFPIIYLLIKRFNHFPLSCLYGNNELILSWPIQCTMETVQRLLCLLKWMFLLYAHHQSHRKRHV